MSSSSAGAAAESPTGLLSLPPTLLQRILSLVLAEDPSLSLALISSLGSHIAQHGGLPILLNSITVVDDDALLVDCEQTTEAPAAPLVAQTPLKAVWRSPSKAEFVKQLVVVKPPPLAYSTTAPASAPLSSTSPTPQDALSRQSVDDDEQGDDQLGGLDLHPPPLEDTSFLLFLTKLSSLRTFYWSTARLPPIHLCPALGAACKGLTEFRFELAESASTSAGDAGAVGSPRISGGGGGAGADKLRWDAPDLSALPLSLTILSLSNLSQLGTRSLASALPSLPNLEDLELARTIFVDDEVMAEIGASARKLRKLKIREMSGTKLSEGGLAEVLEGCTELETLVLDAVEGRFSKSCWTKLTPLPSQLTTLALYYAEPSPHKSWTLDHLLSLPSALPTSSLTTLIVSRKPDPGALIPGRHHHSRFPVDQVMVPKPVGDELVEALLERGDEWRVLELDLWKMGSDELKKIMEGCAGLIKMKILFDAPFRGLLTLASSFALSQNLRHFLLSIDPSHTPELNSMNFLVTPPKGSKATSLPPTPGASPSSTLSPLPTIPADADLQFPASPPSPISMRSPTLGGRRGSLSAVLGLGSNLGAEGGGGGQVVSTAGYAARSPINTREWRRFLKKTHRLEDIEWYGRGGIGRWRFERGHSHVGGGAIGGVGKVEVELEPIMRRVGANGEDMEVGLRSPELGRGGSVAWRCENRRRRSSSASLAGSCLSGLALLEAPTSPTLSQSQDDYGSPKSARSSGGFSSASRGFNGLGLTGLSPATPATSFAASPPSSTSPTASYSSHHSKSPSTSTPSQSRPPLKTATSTGGGVPVVYPGGWHSGGSGGVSKQSPASFGAIGPGAKVNLDKEKERHLEREREKERERVKERQAEAQENAFPPLSPNTSTSNAAAGGGGGGTASSSRSTSGRSSKANSPVLSTGNLPPSPQSPTQSQSPTVNSTSGGGKGRGGKAGRGGAAGGGAGAQAAGEKIIPGLPSSMQGQGQKKGGGRGRK